jgi:hypothetical protein
MGTGKRRKNEKYLIDASIGFFVQMAKCEVNLSFSRKKYGYSKECVFGYRY